MWNEGPGYGKTWRKIRLSSKPNYSVQPKKTDTICVKKSGPSSDHILRSNPVVTLLLHCPRVHGFSLFGKLDFTVYRDYEKQCSGFLSGAWWCIGVPIRPIRTQLWSTIIWSEESYLTFCTFCHIRQQRFLRCKNTKMFVSVTFHFITVFVVKHLSSFIHVKCCVLSS